MVTWTQGSRSAPKDRRLLLIATPETGECPRPHIVVGHWHEAREEFVIADMPYPFGWCRPELNVEWWAEIPDLPEAVALRMLSDDDLWA